MSTTKHFKVGELAKAAQVNVTTIHYYERLGLIGEAERGENGYRHYSPTALQEVVFIKNAQALGFTLEEIKELLSLRGSNIATCGDVRNYVQEKVSAIESKINQLTQLKTALTELKDNCLSDGGVEECTILGAFASKCCEHN